MQLVLIYFLAYGMTESCSCITAHPPEKYDYKYGHTVGTICASTEIKVVDEDGNELGLNEAGEVKTLSNSDKALADLTRFEDSDKGSTNHDGIP